MATQLQCLSGAILAVALGASPVAAQTSDQLRAAGYEFHALTPEQAAVPAADRLQNLARLSNGLFETEATGLRHVASARTCPADLNEWRLDEIDVTPPSPNRPERGDDVQCIYHLAQDQRPRIAVHVSRPIFHNALQSLQETAFALQQHEPAWWAWPINMAPAEYAGANVAMTRGTSFVTPADGSATIELASDIWITGLFVDGPMTPSGDPYWEVKVRPVGMATMRSSFDAAARQALHSVGGLVSQPTAAGQYRASMDDMLRWDNPASPETSALVHTRSGFLCPPPPQGTARRSLMQSPDGAAIQCRYAGPDQFWSMLITPAVQSEGTDSAVQRIQNGPVMNFRSVAAPSISNDARILRFDMSAGAGSRSSAVLVATRNGHAVNLNISTATDALLPSDDQLVRIVAATPAN